MLHHIFLKYLILQNVCILQIYLIYFLAVITNLMLYYLFLVIKKYSNTHNIYVCVL